jgi:phosphoribosyl 1,2-cyclic phosphodiesterase
MLVLEANHDDALLWSGPYPWSVKQRIASSHGHLSNRAAGQLARELYHAGLAHVVLAHLSEHCNHGELAKESVGAALSRLRYRGTLTVAPQDDPMEPVDVRPLMPEQMVLAL